MWEGPCGRGRVGGAVWGVAFLCMSRDKYVFHSTNCVCVLGVDVLMWSR